MRNVATRRSVKLKFPECSGESSTGRTTRCERAAYDRHLVIGHCPTRDPGIYVPFPRQARRRRQPRSTGRAQRIITTLRGTPTSMVEAGSTIPFGSSVGTALTAAATSPGIPESRMGRGRRWVSHDPARPKVQVPPQSGPWDLCNMLQGLCLSVVHLGQRHQGTVEPDQPSWESTASPEGGVNWR